MEKSDIYLQRSGTREDVDAELWDDISDLHLDLWQSTWVPMIDHAKRRLRSAAVPLHKWPQDLHWDWYDKTHWTAFAESGGQFLQRHLRHVRARR